VLPLPPWWVRRMVLAPLIFVVAVAAVVTLPVTAPLAAAWSLLWRGSRWRPLRALTLVVLYLALEAVGLLLLLVVWVVSGFGLWIRRPAFQRWHYDVVQLFLRVLFAATQWVLHVRVDVEGPEPSSYTGRPLVVCCRHAGPGDSFLLVHALTSWYAREPRIVLKETLRWDPAIDVLLSRLPSRFVSARERSRTAMRGSAGGRTVEEEIGDLARHLDDNDALVIFPEGGNFTEHRRARAIERLRRDGHIDGAQRAERMRYVLAPKPGGVLAALDVAGEADVVWVAHTGTDHLFTVADVWRALPTDMVIRMRWWQVPAGEVPAGRDARITWLFTWWHHIDAWIGEQRGERRRRTLRVRLAERRARIPAERRTTRR
jgi:1-acyl-sn-glycerol-3-phosphate acyltransferase